MNLEIFLIILVLGALIGLALGALGGGGSILTVPILVYLLHLDTHVAVTTSLVIVGINALVGTLLHYRAGHVRIKESLLFGIYGIFAAYIGARVSSLLPGPVLLLLFGLLMLIIASMMLRPKKQMQRSYQSWWVTLLGGLGVGFLTGFLGVGGGFLVVPALVLFLGMDMPDAVGSSLVVIALNSASGILGHLSGGPQPWPLIGLFSLAGVVGLFIGTRITKIIPSKRLSQIFALFVFILGIVILAVNIPGTLHYLKMI
ncbi:MAG TPA: sulfite exporter TauE/SafE family protein [Ktedonobacteraceae bacterium]|nr:sulfite exporter TauE/SafE family protein [Ktedonobacteraceae bacterium]